MRAFTATVLSTSPRRQVWLDIMGSDIVPITSPASRLVTAGGREIECYKLDVDRLSQQQRTRLIKYLSGAWKIPVDQIARLVADPAHGVPIRAADLVVAMDLRLFV